ncbi:uncharacterized protein LOC114436559 [Parambassis ranga]|uniref:Uncharacterized protein LOC114436559 n=1 Tax=Parambassis ranga TaxID=210632 RepID=A0A6P7I3X2_9TELE|nr:uncharacterized protein LOC114436559 [Parambassis ranga]
MYKEQFSSPGRATRAQLRPTSAHRRNNPHPRLDFLYPRSVQSSHRSANALPHPLPPTDTGRPLFPPVRHLSFHSPVTTCPDSSLNTVNTEKPQHIMPPVNGSTVEALPSAHRLQKLQLVEPPASTEPQLHAAVKNPQRKIDYQRNVHVFSAQHPRKHAGAQPPTRPQTGNPHATPYHSPHKQYQRCCSNSSLDYSGCYSCFHVVKPYQAGHYIIHPEFVSEGLY